MGYSEDGSCAEVEGNGCVLTVSVSDRARKNTAATAINRTPTTSLWICVNVLKLGDVSPTVSAALSSDSFSHSLEEVC